MSRASTQTGVSGARVAESVNQMGFALSYSGIRDMGSVPDMVFVIDTNKEALAIAEAKKLGISRPRALTAFKRLSWR